MLRKPNYARPPNVIGNAMTDRLKNIILLLICLSTTNFTFGQRERTVNWFFGENAGLKFTPTLQANTLGQVNTDEGCATISDSCGNLLFYTDGLTVYTKNHTVMQNGTGLFSNQSSTQAALIIPKPLNDSIYYIFTTAGQNGYNNYSTVNIKANGGLGSVISLNDTLCQSGGEKQAAIQHCNGTDFWLVCKKPYFPNSYYSFLITSSGVNMAPIVSSSTYTPSFDQVGYLKFSPNGNYLANAMTGSADTVALMNFNKCNGQATQFMFIPADTNVYGLSFSPDNSKLYVSNTYDNGTNKSYLYQYNISSATPTTIIASKTLIKMLPDTTFFGALQIGPDNKIYATQYRASGNKTVAFLSTINNPNQTGLSCNYSDNNFSLLGKKGALGLPNFVESYFNTNYSCLDGVGLKENNFEKGFSVFPNPFSSKTNIQLFSKTIKQIELYNIYGFLVKRIENVNSDKIEMEKGNLDRGIYFLQIKTDNNTMQTCRLVIE
jgi:hypothetical protein